MSCYNEWAPYADQAAHKLLSDNADRYFWQSRAGLRDPPILTDLEKLARAIRA